MLHAFITSKRDEIIERCRAKVSTRPAPRPTDPELEYGIPLFLDQLAATLRSTLFTHPAIGKSATKHGSELLRRGFTIAQVVHDYGGVCQSITELAVEHGEPLTTTEFQTLNLCLDDAIAGAVTEYGRVREHDETERLGSLAHEMRNLLSSAVLSYEVLKTGKVGITGSTGLVLGRSLAGLRNLVDRELAEVRMNAGIHRRERVIVAEFLEEVEIAASMEANARGLRLAVTSVAKDVAINVDRQILASVVANLLQNAFKFTRPGSQVSLSAHTSSDRVLIDVEDQCGGLTPEKTEALFRPFEQRDTDRTGLGLGLTICYRGTAINGGKLHVLDHPGEGCVFTVDLPRLIPVSGPVLVA